VRRFEKGEFVRPRLRFGKRPSHRAGEVLWARGGLLQIFDDPLDQARQLLRGNIIDFRVARSQQVADFGYSSYC
jgi:hypothetical protein